MSEVTRLIPKPGVARDDFSELASREGWVFHDLISPTEDTPYEKIWLTPDGRNGIHWIEDGDIDVTYVTVEGENRDALADRIRELVETYDLDELLEAARTTDGLEGKIDAIYRLGAGAPSAFDRGVFETFERYFGDENDIVRTAAAVAAVYPGWPEFRAPLERLAREDADQGVRETAESILESLPAAA